MTEDPEPTVEPNPTDPEQAEGRGGTDGTDGKDSGQDPREPDRLLNRELSWLSFNGRVLQEAMDPRVPLLDRMNFLAIFSSNLDEFFRVRVASLRSLLRLRKKKLKKLGFRPRRLLREMLHTVTSQQEAFGSTLRGMILPELEANGVFLLNNQDLSPEQVGFLKEVMEARIEPRLGPYVLDDGEDATFFEEGRIYLVTELWPRTEIALGAERPSYGLIEVPSPPLPRFISVPGEGHNVLFLEDVIRLFLDGLFPEHEVGSAYAVKLTRDADLYLDDEFEGDLVEKIRKSLGKRETGLPSRFLYDLQAPYGLISFMKDYLDLDDDDLVPGSRYHNLQDLFQFPRPKKLAGLIREPLKPLPHPTLKDVDSILDAVSEKDRILHFPYQSYDYVIRFLREAGQDPRTRSIWITLYRVGKDSAVVRALIDAAKRGVKVTVFVEVKARFDEARNLKWAGEMEEAGVRVFYSKPGIKVHAKIALVIRDGERSAEKFAYLGTGNFNESTAGVYADHALLTSDPRLTDDVEEVFRFLWEETDAPRCEHLLVAPFSLRSGMENLIQREIDNARAGMVSGLAFKMNSIQDPGMIDAVYDASRSGVRVNLVVRGICCIRPGFPGTGSNIRGRSIVDRFLEHARIYRFVNGGLPLLYLASADLMKRNLDGRVEVAFPIFDEGVRAELEHFLHLQLADNTKARILDQAQANNYVGRRVGEPRVQAQDGFYEWLKAESEGLEGAQK